MDLDEENSGYRSDDDVAPQQSDLNNGDEGLMFDFKSDDSDSDDEL